MGLLTQSDIQSFISTYGYWFIGLIVGIESMGIPCPGETALVLAAIYAATTPDFSITGVILAATIGAIVGDNLGYLIGRRYGFPLALRHGSRIGLTEDRIKLGQYLFKNYGGHIVFLGRFIALLRIMAAFLAGVNRMPWPSFMVANAAGGVVWALVFGLGGYKFGDLVFEEHEKWGKILAAGAVILFFGIGFLIHRFEKHLVVYARAALPGPLDRGQGR
jgi:membrane protein DedA with SNARE-associated domain